MAVSLIAIWMLGVAAIAVFERHNIADVPDLWEGSRLLPVLILGWPVTTALYLAGFRFGADEEEGQ